MGSLANVDVTELSLTGGDLVDPVVDDTQVSFHFANLLAGTYELALSGVATGSDGGFYVGALSTVPADDPTVSVLGPASLSVLGLGLIGMASLRRRPKG